MNANRTLEIPLGHPIPFKEVYRETQARLLRRNVLVAAFVYAAFVGWDMVVAPMHVGTTVEIRSYALAFCAFLFVASSSARFRRFYNWYFIALLTIAALDAAAILWVVPGGFAFGIPGIMICIAASSVLFRATGWATAVSGVLATLGTVVLMGLHGEPEYLIRSAAIFMVTAVGFAVLHSVQAERAAHDVYTAQARLEAEKARTESLLTSLTTMRRERLTWLESLARFLRHELSNQIVAVSTSIDLAKSDGSKFGAEIYLERAQRSLNRMRGLVSSATEATSLEGALAVDERKRIDWSDVVIDGVRAFQQLHPSRNMTLKLRSGLSVDGNEERLAQLLDKLLGNAFEHAGDEDEIRVELKAVNDGWIELSVENEGDPLPANKEQIFEAFVSSQSRPENLGLGLFVVQSIARNHGGHVDAEDLPGGRGALFTVRIPSARHQAERIVETNAVSGTRPARRNI